MKIVKIALFFLIISTSGLMHAQKAGYDINKKYPVDELKRDLLILKKSIYKWHPAPFAYISKDSLDLYFNDLSNEITQPLSEFEFRYYLRRAITKVGCGHMGVSASKRYTKAVKKITRKLLPLKVWIIDDHLYVSKYAGKDSLLQKGDEIIAIDSIPAKQLITTLCNIAATDGKNTTHKINSIERSFPIYYAIYRGFRDSYQITINREQVTKTLNIIPIEDKKDTVKVISKENWYINKKTHRLKLAEYNSSVAIMDIDNFVGKHQRAFFRRSFRYIKKQHCQSLVIDLRGNGGGSAFKGNHFLSYILDKPVHRMVFERKPIPVWPARYLRTGFWSKLTPILFMANPIEYPRKGKLVHEFLFVKKLHNHFNGKIFVLTDGGTFSMAAIVAAYLKYKVNAKIIGEETGGGEAGCNAMTSGEILLPKTHARVTVPFYHIRNTIPVTDEGHGVMPDYPVKYSIEDRMKGNDKVMYEVKKLTER